MPRLVQVEQVADDIDLEIEAAAKHDVGFERSFVNATEEIPDAVGDADGILVRFMPVTDDVLGRCPSVRVVGRGGVGVDNVDVEAATRRGVAVVNVPDYCVEEVATHAAALVLAHNRRILPADAMVREGRWGDWPELMPIRPLSEQTLGLVGLGRIGAATATLLSPLFRRTIAYDPFADAFPAGVASAELDEVFAEADVVSLHTPLTPDTRQLADARRLASMREGSLLVNVSRGGLVDEQALAAALRKGRPGAAALDVLATEPPPSGHPLQGLPNVTITNHVAWLSTAALIRNRALLAERCAAYLVGAPAVSVVNGADL